jgi:isocitrate dehydrogenase
MRKRGSLDGIDELVKWADKMEEATIKTIENGIMTKDLIALSTIENKKGVNSKDFLLAIKETFDNM